MQKTPLDGFTLPARVIIVFGILLAAGGTWAYIDWAWEGLPQGSYPLFLFALPMLVLAGIVVGLGLFALHLLGIPIRQVPPEQGPPEEEPPAPGNV